jgi:hypothetical protein
MAPLQARLAPRVRAGGAGGGGSLGRVGSRLARAGRRSGIGSAVGAAAGLAGRVPGLGGVAGMATKALGPVAVSLGIAKLVEEAGPFVAGAASEALRGTGLEHVAADLSKKVTNAMTEVSTALPAVFEAVSMAQGRAALGADPIQDFGADLERAKTLIETERRLQKAMSFAGRKELAERLTRQGLDALTGLPALDESAGAVVPGRSGGGAAAGAAGSVAASSILSDGQRAGLQVAGMASPGFAAVGAALDNVELSAGQAAAARRALGADYDADALTDYESPFEKKLKRHEETMRMFGGGTGRQ